MGLIGKFFKYRIAKGIGKKLLKMLRADRSGRKRSSRSIRTRKARHAFK